MWSLLCNTGTSGSNGDGRIRYSTDFYYSRHAFSPALYVVTAGNWEKSVGACIIPCARKFLY